MTFRTRLVLAATGAVLVVVVLGSLATYIVAYNSLVGSVDVTLNAEAQTVSDEVNAQEVPNLANNCGRPRARATRWSTPVASPTPATRSAAHYRGPARWRPPAGARPRRSTSRPLANGMRRARDRGRPAPGLSSTRGTTGPGRSRPGGGALQITAPLDRGQPRAPPPGRGPVADRAGRGHRGRAARLRRWAAPCCGPLNSLTRTVEELAETTDVSKRLDPGGPDELGRLRRAFNRLLAALDTSRESQRQLVLDASHELRTPLTSLRTNMEVARRLEELDPEEREVLIGDVLTQLDELTTLVADLAELARGEQPQLTARADPARHRRPRGGGGGHHPRSQPGRDLRRPGGPHLGVGLHRPHRPGRGQPARQRPQVEPGRRGGRGGLLGRAP